MEKQAHAVTLAKNATQSIFDLIKVEQGEEQQLPRWITYALETDLAPFQTRESIDDSEAGRSMIETQTKRDIETLEQSLQRIEK